MDHLKAGTMPDGRLQAMLGGLWGVPRGSGGFPFKGDTTRGKAQRDIVGEALVYWSYLRENAKKYRKTAHSVTAKNSQLERPNSEATR